MTKENRPAGNGAAHTTGGNRRYRHRNRRLPTFPAAAVTVSRQIDWYPVYLFVAPLIERLGPAAVAWDGRLV